MQNEEKRKLEEELGEKRHCVSELNAFVLEILKDLHIDPGIDEYASEVAYEVIIEKGLNAVRSNYIRTQKTILRLKQKLKKAQEKYSQISQMSSGLKSSYDSGDQIFRTTDPKISFEEYDHFYSH